MLITLPLPACCRRVTIRAIRHLQVDSTYSIYPIRHHLRELSFQRVGTVRMLPIFGTASHTAGIAADLT